MSATPPPTQSEQAMFLQYAQARREAAAAFLAHSHDVLADVLKRRQAMVDRIASGERPDMQEIAEFAELAMQAALAVQLVQEGHDKALAILATAEAHALAAGPQGSEALN